MSPAVMERPAPVDLERAQRDLVELEGELQLLEAARRERQADLDKARRDKKAREVAATIGGELATLERIIADQRKDTNEARATVERIRSEGERAAREAALKATHAELVDLQARFGEALVEGVEAVEAAFAPARAVRSKWIEARSRAVEQMKALGIPTSGSGQEVRRAAYQALEALDCGSLAVFEAPDSTTRAFPGLDREAHFPVPPTLADRARALGPMGQGDAVTTRAFLSIARAALAAC